MRFTTFGSIALLCLAGCSRPEATLDRSPVDEQAELYLHSQPGSIPVGLLSAFEEETGIRVHDHPFDTDEELEARLVNKQSGYDLVMPTAAFAKAQVDKQLFLRLDKSLLTGLDQLDTRVMAALAQFDAGNQHLLPWSWTYATVGFNRSRVESALAGQALPSNPWDLVFNPMYTRKLRACGIVVRPLASVIVPAALQHLGLDPESASLSDYQAASQLLSQVRPDVARFSATLAVELAEKRACVVLGWASGINLGAQLLRDSRDKERIEFSPPRGAALVTFQTLAIPTDAPHPGNAHKFIAFFLKPENTALMTSNLGSGALDARAKALVDADLAGHPGVFLPPDTGTKIIPLRRGSGDAADAAKEVFQAFRNGTTYPGPAPANPAKK